MVTSYFSLEVEIWPYHTCAMKHMQYNPYLMAESPTFYRNSSVIVLLAMKTVHILPLSGEDSFVADSSQSCRVTYITCERAIGQLCAL